MHSVPSPPPQPPPAHVVDRALEESVARLARLLQQRGNSVLENDMDAHELLANIKTHMQNLSVPAEAPEPQRTADWSPPKSAESKEAGRPRPTRASPAAAVEQSPKALSEEAWGNLVDRLNDSLKKHKVNVSVAQQDLLATELEQLTFRPQINPKSRLMVNALSLAERTAQMEEKKRERLEAERARMRVKELEGATFRPHIVSKTATPRYMSPNRSSERMQALASKVASQREAEDRENLTFSPALNPKSLAMAPRGKALAAAGSPAKPVITQTSADAGHEQETFRPEINAHSRRLAAAKTKPVHERLYDERVKPAAAAASASGSPTKSAGKTPHVRSSVVVFHPEHDWILHVLDDEAASHGER